ncbi:hypothetical protein [Streptomyces sp. NPDC002666]
MRDEKKMLVTYGHMEAWGAQTELRAIQRRNRDATIKIRAAGRPKGKPYPIRQSEELWGRTTHDALKKVILGRNAVGAQLES